MAAGSMWFRRKLLVWPMLVGVLNLALVVVLCWQLAQWTWVFLAPRQQQATAPRVHPNADQLLAAVRSAHLFGASTQSVAVQGETATPLDLKLTGVFAANGKLPPAAIIKVEGQKELPFSRGDKILPDVVLDQVGPDYVVLRRNGGLERLDLESKSARPGSAQVATQFNVRREGEGRFALKAAELAKLLSDPAQLASVGKFSSLPGGGIRVEDTGPGNLMGKLGLQRGDVVRSVNGSPVSQLADLLRGYHEQLERGSTISVQGTRNGQAFEYNYALK